MQLKPEDVARYYDAWTPHYIAAFGPCIQAHRPSDDDDLLDYLADRIGLKAGMRALDAGCGVCGPARHFAARTGAFIDALTISPLQARMSEEANAAAGLTQNIRVTLGDFHDLIAIYGNEAFDAVYFLESLSHSAEPARAIRSVCEVLKPGGWIYIKDFFVRPCESEITQQEILNVVSRVNGLFEVKTAWARDIIGHLHEAGLVMDFVERPGFAVDNSRWQSFERTHGIDLFAGKESFDWSEWFEIKFRKLEAGRKGWPEPH
jgi:cyclopropane fatty-acyl-phospholipid synthase-like methyltransferase